MASNGGREPRWLVVYHPGERLSLERARELVQEEFDEAVLLRDVQTLAHSSVDTERVLICDRHKLTELPEPRFWPRD